ncbi:MAG: DUF2817 domain-containing protein [Spirochaetia bacterium]|nr:DUF2817 domain-containing protein [Spirochaetia bacterium]
MRGFPAESVMKKTASVLIGTAIIVVLLLAGVNVYFSRLPQFSDSWPADPTLAPFFKETYDESRAAFREGCSALAAKIPGTQSMSFRIESRRVKGLTIDACRVPSAKSDRLLIVTAGIHGGEGFASAAVERHLMQSLPGRALRPEILLVHGINAFGMKVFRRVTENNVDLNRNFDVKPDLFQEKNEGYKEVNPLLNPQGPADLSSSTYRLFALRAISNIVSKGMGKLRQAVLQGQYDIPKGIYYGGNAFEQQKGILEPLFKTAGQGKAIAVIVDLHTGYGERGICHLFPNPPANEQVRTLTNTLFQGYQIDWGDQGDFYTVHEIQSAERCG